MIALQQGTTDDNFRRSLAKRAPENMNELQERAGKYIKTEESLKKSQNNQGPTPNPKKRGNDTEYNADSKYSKTGDGDKSPTKKRAGLRFTEFHKDTEHKTDDCRQLKDEIEFLIRKGKLSRYTRDTDRNSRDNDNRGKDNDDRDKRNQPRGPVINVISGGPTAAGLSTNSRKAYAREVMCILGEPPKRAKIEFSLAFDNLDLDRVKFPHDDPLVITMVIGTSSVKMVLVDSGALSRYLFMMHMRRWDILIRN
nr:PREDICTED: uncharacterized protein LOC108204075 [Daucus carota subsp. sativus]